LNELSKIISPRRIRRGFFMRRRFSTGEPDTSMGPTEASAIDKLQQAGGFEPLGR
jgi:hypothetical protein